MSDSYYELIDGARRAAASGSPRPTSSAAPGRRPFSTARRCRRCWSVHCERCEPRDDTRLSRVLIDLLGPVPADGDLWVRAQPQRSGKQIELVSAEMLALGPDGEPRPVARASGWRLQTHRHHRGRARPGAARCARWPRRPSRDMTKDWDRNYVHSLDWRWLTEPMSDGPGESWLKPIVDLVKGETMTPLERLFAVADDANGIGTKLDIRKWTFLNTDLVVHVHRVPDGRVDRHPRRDQLRARRDRHHDRDAVRRTRRRRRHPAVGARPSPPHKIDPRVAPRDSGAPPARGIAFLVVPRPRITAGNAIPRKKEFSRSASVQRRGTG